MKKFNFLKGERIVRDIINFLRYDIKRGVWNLIRWFPVVWKDRNWDQYYIYCILHHKLNLMEKNIRSNNNHTRAIKDANDIKKCVLILNRLIEDNYHENSFKRHDEKWGHPELNLGNNRKVYIFHKNVLTEKDEQEEIKDSKRSHKHAMNLKKQDLEILFDTMKKHIECWWD